PALPVAELLLEALARGHSALVATAGPGEPFRPARVGQAYRVLERLGSLAEKGFVGQRPQGPAGAAAGQGSKRFRPRRFRAPLLQSIDQGVAVDTLESDPLAAGTHRVGEVLFAAGDKNDHSPVWRLFQCFEEGVRRLRP